MSPCVQMVRTTGSWGSDLQSHPEAEKVVPAELAEPSFQAR
jgi:hypothetical protein